MIKHFWTDLWHESHRPEVDAAMAHEAMLASALDGVTERRNAHYDAYEADDDTVPFTRSEGTKQNLI